MHVLHPPVALLLLLLLLLLPALAVALQHGGPALDNLTCCEATFWRQPPTQQT